MKKILILLLALMLSLGLLAGCSSEEQAPEEQTSTAETFLTVTVGDEVVEMTKDEFEALPMVEHEISKTNSKGETTTATYKGVQWPDLADFVGAEDEATVTAVASDGYEVEITPEMLNDSQAMFALYEDGEVIESQDGGEVWFCAGEAFSANNWAKYIVELKVQ